MENFVGDLQRSKKLAKEDVVRKALQNTSYKPYPIPVHRREYLNNMAADLSFNTSSDESEEFVDLDDLISEEEEE